MAKLDDLKAKISGAIAKLTQRFRKGGAPGAPAAPAAPNPNSLLTLYRQGDTITRVAVIGITLLLILGSVSMVYFSVRLYQALRQAQDMAGSDKDYSKQIEALSTKINEAASIISIGSAAVSTHDASGKRILISVDLWVRCDSALTAGTATAIEVRLRDRAVVALKNTLRPEVNLFTDEGKAIAKAAILKGMNAELSSGKIVEVYFHNLVAQ